MLRKLSITFGLALGCLGQSLGATYQVTSLGIPDGATASFGMSLNSQGDVAGIYYRSGGGTGSFIYSAGAMRDISAPGATRITAAEINDTGSVVGVYNGNGSRRSDAFLYDGSTVQSLNSSPNRSSSAQDISNTGLVVGTTMGTNGIQDGFKSVNGDFQILGLTNGTTRYTATGVNDLGQISGTATNNQTRRISAYILDTATNALTFSPDWYYMETWAMNIKGHVVGGGIDLQGTAARAFLWADGALTKLGTLVDTETPGYGLGTPEYSSARSINDSGLIVGFYGYAGYEGRPFVYADGVMSDLNDMLIQPEDSDWVLVEAFDVNNAGQIVGYGYMPGRYGSTALLLTPVNVPEPASMMLVLLAGFMAFAVRGHGHLRALQG